VYKYILVPLGGSKLAEVILPETVSFFLTEKSPGVTRKIDLGT